MGSALHRDGTGSAGGSCASQEVLFLKKASGCVFPVQVGDTDGFCSRMRMLLVQDSSVFMRHPRQRLPELQLSLLGQEDGKGQAGSGQGGQPALHQGYGRENTFRRGFAEAWPFLGTSHPCLRSEQGRGQSRGVFKPQRRLPWKNN